MYIYMYMYREIGIYKCLYYFYAFMHVHVPYINWVLL